MQQPTNAIDAVLSMITHNEDVKQLLSNFKFDLTYDEQMLVSMQNWIDDQRPRLKRNPLLPSTILLLGVMLGETVIKKIPESRWINKDIPNIANVEVEVKKFNSTLIKLSPFVSIMNYVADKTQTLLSKFQMVELLHNKDIDSKEFSKNYPPDEEGWITLENGYMFRKVK